MGNWLGAHDDRVRQTPCRDRFWRRLTRAWHVAGWSALTARCALRTVALPCPPTTHVPRQRCVDVPKIPDPHRSSTPRRERPFRSLGTEPIVRAEFTSHICGRYVRSSRAPNTATFREHEDAYDRNRQVVQRQQGVWLHHAR